MNRLMEALKGRTLLFDGAMGSMLQAGGLKPGACPEELNVSGPRLVEDIHARYTAAGADLLTTNTFGASRPKLAEYGLEGRLAELNAAGVYLARRAADAAGRVVFVAGDMGPTGRFLSPVGEMGFDEAYDIFAEQAGALAKAGADLILIETMSDIKEAKAAVMAAKEATGLPVAITMTFQRDLRTLLGTPPEVAVTVLSSAGADIVGANCSLGPEGLYEVAKAMAGVAGVPLLFQPNAGLPELVDGKTVYPATPAELAGYAEKFMDLGVSVIGSCCGSVPEHTQAMSKAIAARSGGSPRVHGDGGPTRLASRTRLVSVGAGHAPVIIGERINPTGRSGLTRELSAGKTVIVKKDARDQTEAGAALLDINVGLPGGDEAALLPKVIRAAEEASDAPLVIDSTDPAAIEAALKECSGKALVNSVTADKARLDSILPLVKRYGAAVIGLTLDEKGVPASAKKRLELARNILKACEKRGIKRQDVVIDALVLTASAEQAQAMETLKAVSMIKEKLGVATSLGVSNVSFGLPERGLVNASYLTMALGYGLDCAMVNPYDKACIDAVSAGAVLTGRDLRADSYIKKHGKQKAQGPITGAGSATLPMFEASGTGTGELTVEKRLQKAVIEGDRENIVPLIEEALKDVNDPLVIGNECLIPALKEVGRLYETHEIFLPQVMSSAETMKAAFARLKKEMKAGAASHAGTVVLATVFGDVHDIGKNILSMLLENHGYNVIDLGKNVPREKILDTAKENKADIICLSALMTTTMTEMEQVIKERDKRGINTPVVIGGAVVTGEYAKKIGAAGASRDAMEAVELIKGIIEKR